MGNLTSPLYLLPRPMAWAGAVRWESEARGEVDPSGRAQSAWEGRGLSVAYMCRRSGAASPPGGLEAQVEPFVAGRPPSSGTVPAEAWLWPSWEAPRESGVLAGPTQHLSHCRVMGPPVSWALTPGDSCRQQDGEAPLWAGRPGPGECRKQADPSGLQELRILGQVRQTRGV